MDIASMAAASSTSIGAEDANNGGTAAASDSLADKQAFLQLLIAQIKNQDPLNPADGLEFLTQLAQFSQLEQLMGIRSELEALRKDPAPESGSSGAAA